MGYTVAVLVDDTFEEPRVILGQSRNQVGGAVAAYLRVARPKTAKTGGRLFVPEKLPEGFAHWFEWLEAELDDVDDVSVRWLSSTRGMGDGLIEYPSSFKAWVSENADALARQHALAVEDVVVVGNVL